MKVTFSMKKAIWPLPNHDRPRWPRCCCKSGSHLWCLITCKNAWKMLSRCWRLVFWYKVPALQKHCFVFLTCRIGCFGLCRLAQSMLKAKLSKTLHKMKVLPPSFVVVSSAATSCPFYFFCCCRCAILGPTVLLQANLSKTHHKIKFLPHQHQKD